MSQEQKSVRSASLWQSLTHGSERRGLHRLSLRVENSEHGRQRGRSTSQKIPQASLRKCNNAVNLQSLHLTGMYMSGVHLVGERWGRSLGMEQTENETGAKGVKEAVRWDRDTPERPERRQQPTRCRRKKLPEFSPSHSPIMESKVPQTLSLLCFALAAVPPTHVPQGGNLLPQQLLRYHRVLGHGHEHDKQVTVGPGRSRLKVILLSECH